MGKEVNESSAAFKQMTKDRRQPVRDSSLKVIRRRFNMELLLLSLSVIDFSAGTIKTNCFCNVVHIISSDFYINFAYRKCLRNSGLILYFSYRAEAQMRGDEQGESSHQVTGTCPHFYITDTHSEKLKPSG